MNEVNQQSVETIVVHDSEGNAIGSYTVAIVEGAPESAEVSNEAE